MNPATAKPQAVRLPLEMRKPVRSAERLREHDVLARTVLSAGGTAVGEVDKNPCLYGACVLVVEGRQQAKTPSERHNIRR